MLESGTALVGGVSPGRSGRAVHGVPVYETVTAALAQHRATTSVLFTPALAARSAALEALAAGIQKVILLAEFVPCQDTLEVIAEAKALGAQVLGPNTAGLVVPGVASVGIMPGFAPNIFQPGSVGVISRSGSLGTLLCLNLTRAGYGQSAFIGIGGDSIVGTTILEALQALDADDRTKAVVLVGEVGGTLEEEAANYAATMSKPVIAFIAGCSAPPGRRMGHAGAIVIGSRGTWHSKAVALRDAGVVVLDSPSQVSDALLSSLTRVDADLVERSQSDSG